MNYLELFSGISAGRLALQRCGFTVQNYYRAEIEDSANKVSSVHCPEAINLGDVTKWREWSIDWGSIHLVTAGFPCQSWSMAGQQMGDKDPRGALFWVTLDIIKMVLKHNPKAKWLMENVKMKSDFENYITHHTKIALNDINKYLINSSLLTAQNRERFYWANFYLASPPQDKGIVLADILENIDVELRPCIRRTDNTKTSGLMHVVNASDINGHDILKRVYSIKGKSPTLTAASGGNQEPKIEISNGLYRKITIVETARLQTFPDDWCASISNSKAKKCYGNAWTVDVIQFIFANGV